jgi:4-diphosphocytidyl-2-C-methyl-D-erythritol kinase
LPLNEDNIAYLAAKLYLEKAGIAGGVYIKIEKRIPVKGGMAGGSTDAAAVLEALNEIYGALDFAALSEIAASIGADVPFFLYGDKVMLGRGTGTALTEIGKINFDIYGVFVCYGEKQSTGAAYGMLDTLRGENAPLKTCDKIVGAISENDFCSLVGAIENDFELVSSTFDEVKAALEKLGCEKVFLCGSGPTVCGIFQNEGTARTVAEKLPYDTFVCKIGI